MAKQLIESLSTDFDPSAYEDEYRSELLALIERKAAGEDVLAAKPEAPKPTKAPDLMAALEESLAAIKGEELSGDAAKARRSGSEEAQVGGEERPARAKPKSKSRPRPRSRDRRPPAVDHQPRQGPLPGGGLHQGRGHRLLRPDRRRRSSPTSATGR